MLSAAVREIAGKAKSEELIQAIGLWILVRRRAKQRRKRRFYVRGINLTRSTDGAFANLIRPMRSAYDDDHFCYFRMSRRRFDDLLRRIAPRITHAGTHRIPISPEHRLAMTLRYLCDGGSISEKAYSFRVGKATLTRIINETTNAIWDSLKGDYLAEPNRQKWQDIADEFWIKWNFPLVIAAVDGRHIAIKCPPKSGSLHFNYKKFFSVVLLAVVDASYNYIFVDIGGCGREGDAGLFRQSSFGQRLDSPMLPYERGGLDIPRDTYIPGTNVKAPHVFLGDEAFPLRRHLMKPYQYRTATGAEEAYNYRLSRARRVVENCFGITASRFRVLDGRINLRPKAADSVVKATCALHNYLKFHDADDYAEPRYVPRDFVDYAAPNGDVVEGEWRCDLRHHNYAKLATDIDDNPTRLAYGVRERFKAYFSSDVGKLPWQDQYVRDGKY